MFYFLAGGPAIVAILFMFVAASSEHTVVRRFWRPSVVCDSFYFIQGYKNVYGSMSGSYAHTKRRRSDDLNFADAISDLNTIFHETSLSVDA